MKPVNSREIKVGDIVLLNRGLAEGGKHSDLTCHVGKWVIVSVGASCGRQDCQEDYGCVGHMRVKNLETGFAVGWSCWGWGKGRFMWILEEQVPMSEQIVYHVTEVIENDFE